MLFGSITHLLGTLSEQAIKPLLYTADLIIQSCPSSLWAPAMESQGFVLAAVRTFVYDVGGTVCFLFCLSAIAISSG